jgi:outer membrane protein assembly factor BamB
LLVANLVIQNCDADTDAYLVALDKATGAEVWKTKRPDFRGWSSPILVRSGERQEVVVNGHTGVSAYDPGSGALVWYCRCPEGRGEPTVTPSDGVLFTASGLSGGGAYAIRPGGNGDVTDSRRLWFAPRSGRDLPSPIVVGDAVMVAGLRGGMLTAYDRNSGQELWTARLQGQVPASPIAYDGLAFFLRESGETLVVDPKSDEKIVAVNESLGQDADETFRASITPSEGQLLVRSDRTLYCVGTRSREGSPEPSATGSTGSRRPVAGSVR